MTMYETIYENAKQLFASRFPPLEGPIDLQGQPWINWCNCWFEALDNLHQSIHEEGSSNTSKYLVEIGEEQSRFNPLADPKYLENMYAREMRIK